MNSVALSKTLGYVSLGIGAMELAMPGQLSKSLGLPGGPGLVRGYGARELMAGVMVLTQPDSAIGPIARVVGDVMDIATLVPALSGKNEHRTAATLAFAMVAGITALDILCASALAADEKRRAATARRTGSVAPTVAPVRPPAAASLQEIAS